MRLAFLFVACQSTLSYRPDGGQAALEVSKEPCQALPLRDVCQTELTAGQCVLVTDTTLPARSCKLRGPEEGFAILRPATGASNVTVTIRSTRGVAILHGGLILRQVRLAFEGLRLQGARLQMFDTFGATSGTSPTRDGGAIWAGRRGMTLVESQILVNSSTARYGGAIHIERRGQLSLKNHSRIVTERTQALLAGGSISTRNLRVENASQIVVANSIAKDGGGISADMFVIRTHSAVHITGTESLKFGGAVHATRRLVVMHSELGISNCSADKEGEGGGGGGGGGLFVGNLQVRQAAVDIRNVTCGAKCEGGCVYAARDLSVQGGSVWLANCTAYLSGGLRVGGTMTLANSSSVGIARTEAVAGSAGLSATKVYVEDSVLRILRSRSMVAPAALSVISVLRLTGGTLVINDTSRDLPWPAMVVGNGNGFTADANGAAEVHMARGGGLILQNAYSGLLAGKNSSIQLENCHFQDLNTSAIESPSAHVLKISDSSSERISGTAFVCIDCRSLSLSRMSGRHVRTFVRATGLTKLSADKLQVSCTSRSYVQFGIASEDKQVFRPKSWRLEDLDIHLEDVDSLQKPIIMEFQVPKVNGSTTSLKATCPAGSFSVVQETFGTVVKLFNDVLLNMVNRREMGEEASTCCISTADLPHLMRFNRSEKFVLTPNLTAACNPATYPCLCNDGRCNSQMRKMEVAFVRISCMPCPVGQYSLEPVERSLNGDSAGLFGPAALFTSSEEQECISCESVSSQVYKKVLCQGSSITVPKSVMAAPIGLRPESQCSARRLCFYRCPNSGACPGGVMSAAEPICAPGYNRSSPGCVRCSSGFGRKNTDPFVCTPCGRWDLGMAYFVLLPLAPVWLAVRSAGQTEKERMSMMLKVMLSFGTFVDSLHTILERTVIYESLKQQFRVALGLIQGAGASSTLVSTSFDCLLEALEVTRWKHLLLQASHPVILLVLFAALEFGHWRTAFQASWCRRCIVLGNSFLPALFAAFIQWTPCFHLQKVENGRADSFAAYRVSEPCSSVLALAMPLAGLALLLLAGPTFWASLVSASRKWPAETRKRYVGFLIAGYQEQCEWWEITVLLRKALLTAAAVLLPVSYAPLTLVLATAVIMLAALVGHLAMKPYADEFMNILEGGVLTYSMAALMGTLYLMSDNWALTSKPLVFAVLVTATAATSLVLLLVFVLTALPKTRHEVHERPAGPPAG